MRARAWMYSILKKRLFQLVQHTCVQLILQFIISRLVRHAPSFHHTHTNTDIHMQCVMIALGNERRLCAAQLQKASHGSVAKLCFPFFFFV